MNRLPIYGDLKLRHGKMELVKETTISTDIPVLSRAKEMANFINKHLDLSNLCEEQFWIMALNASLEPLGFFKISQGNLDTSLTNIGGIFKRLLLTNAYSFCAVHNHPSGSVIPSEADIETTKLLKQSAELMEMQLVDHIIIGKGKYRSIRKDMQDAGVWN